MNRRIRRAVRRTLRPDDGRQDADFAPDRILDDGDMVSVGGVTFRAVHTPGHASNHLCYLWEERRAALYRDHVMQGSTVVISPPDGDMAAYPRFARQAAPPRPRGSLPATATSCTPHEEVRRLVAHRLKREHKVLEAVRDTGGGTLPELVKRAYDDAPERLHTVAQRLRSMRISSSCAMKGRWRGCAGRCMR